jgi:hypothetical protein
VAIAQGNEDGFNPPRVLCSPSRQRVGLCLRAVLLASSTGAGWEGRRAQAIGHSRYTSDREHLSARLAAVAGIWAAGRAIAVEANKQGVSPSDSEEIHPASSAKPMIRRVLGHIPSLAIWEEKLGRGNEWKLVSTAVLGILSAAISVSLWTRSAVFPGARVALQVSDLGPNIRIAWDPTREPFRAATGGVLEIRDGDRPAEYLPITRDGLNGGRMFYGPRSDKIDVRLQLLRGNETVSESKLYLIINPERSAATLPVDPVPPATPEAAASVFPTALLEPQSQEPVPSPSESHSETREQAPTPMSKPSARARTFSPPLKRSSGSTEIGMQARLPELPEIHTAQPPVAIPLPSASPIALRPPPPTLARQTPDPVPPQPRSGRLIWTGDLRKNGLLALSSAGASQGVLNGRLPGFPIKVSVQPAELVGGGIAIFSSDQKKAGVTEPPSARNGWNVVVYKWDPKRASEVSVIEPPGPSNRWKQLVLGAGNHNVSVLVVDWQGDGDQ